MEKLKNVELIQALIRASIGLLTYLYISAGIDSGYFDTTMDVLNTFSLIFFAFTALVIISIYWIPVSTPRRYTSLTFDIASATFSSFLTGGINSVYVLIYLWIYIGYGTRYGKNFLLTAVAMTFIGYNILLLTEDAWTILTLDAIAFLLLIIALPIYLYSLQKRLQEAVSISEQANRTTTEFLSSMTHQIRTPIGGVVGMIDLLNKTHLDAQQKQYLHALSQSSNALQEIVEDIVDFSHIDQGKISLYQKSIQPRTIINSVAHSLAPMAHEKNIEVNCLIDKTFPKHVFSDAQRLRQLLSNLVRYAIEKCSNHEVFVKANAEPGQINEPINVTITIEFRQAAGSAPVYAHSIPKTDDALALRIGSQLIRLMGGIFEISYDDDTLTSFVVQFKWQRDKLHNETSPNFAGKRVLIFEPDKGSRNVLENYCSQMEIEPYFTEGNDNLVAHLLWSKEKNKLFDAIILCESLKQNDARNLIHRIRHEAQYQAPLLYATYIKNIELMDPDALKDVQATIIKPFALELLSHSLDHLFKLDQDERVQQPDISHRYRILLAEDSEINAGIIYSHLTDLGHDVDIATDGETALYAMNKHKYDIVFMDISMPKIDGIEATRQWRMIEDPAAPLPIIAVTAKATADDKKQCMDAGMNGFLTKPVSATQLGEVLKNFL
ncbi:MAG TPA: response regulator [Gammaproteobacteria bacterium]